MQFFKRSVYCGQINKEHVNKEVTLNGWVARRRDLGSLIFVDLRDRTGIIQLILDPTINQEVATLAHDLRSEFVIAVKGTVINRAPEAVNKNMATGLFEVQVTQLQILNKSSVLPFQLDLDNEDKISEELRLKYRYLDLRRKKMHDCLKIRHEVLFTIREYFNQQEFYEIETPALSKSTPGGARNFLVPSRLQPTTFYGLSESPQIYKQLLMVGGMEKYFQIARCFRDEALRSNRQPEFTQLDIEMTFVDEKDIQTVCEDLFSILWKKFLQTELKLPLVRRSYDDVFSRFGSDKPDIRFELEINDVTPLFTPLGLNFIKTALDAGGKAGALVVKNHSFSRTDLDKWSNHVTKELGAKGLLWFKWTLRDSAEAPPQGEPGNVESPVAKFLPTDFFEQAQKALPGLTKQDTLFVVIGEYEEAWTTLGQLRLALGKALNLIDTTRFDLFWVTDFPMFEWNKEAKRWDARHHQFTSPQDGWEKDEIKNIKARAYDLVCNGEELGGGSIRIHSSEIQSKVFDILGISKEKAEEKFKFLLEAQNFGYPPEGGVAFGIDRLIMMLSGTDAIRDVIAFPKTQHGSDLMMQSPSIVEDEQLKELHIKSTFVPKKG